MLEAATAPVIVLLFYCYIRDKYEKEPFKMLFWGLICGVYVAFVVYGLGMAMERLFPHEETPLYTAFLSSALIEEGVKFLFLYFLICRNKEFNEPFDGIVYGVFVSLGFAWIENMVYVTHPIWGGLGTAVARAVISLPGHGLFGVQMGYWFGKYRFEQKKYGLVFAFVVAYLYHGFYNYFLLWEWQGAKLLFGGLFFALCVHGVCCMQYFLKHSPFRPTGEFLSRKR